MILRTDSSLIDPVAAALILLGLVSASIQPKKNYFVLIWFFIGFLPFHVFLGLLLPRMWFLSFGLLYLLAAIGTDTAIQIVSKWKHPYARIIALCAGCMLAGFALQRNISTFYTSAVKNFTFREDFREVWEIAKHRRRVLPDQVLFITQDENFDCTRTLAAFVWVSDHKDQAGSLNGSGNHAMSVFSQNDLQPALEVLPRKKCLIVENPVLSDLEKQIPPGVHLSLLNTGCYYTEFLITRDKL
jgi:hypothetical protein